MICFLSGPVVTLDRASGGDLAVVNAARTSYARESAELTDADAKLISYLARERHGTPFEAAVFWFHVQAPIFVAREAVRHRIASWNEVSGRYVELPGNFYVPDMPNVRVQVGKPGHYDYVQAPYGVAVEARGEMEAAYSAAWGSYQRLLRLGVARELARAVLPVGLFTEWRWVMNARSLMNFLSLRTAPNAMREIRDLASQVESHFEAAMPATHAAWVAAGRAAP